MLITAAKIQRVMRPARTECEKTYWQYWQLLLSQQFRPCPETPAHKLGVASALISFQEEIRPMLQRLTDYRYVLERNKD